MSKFLSVTCRSKNRPTPESRLIAVDDIAGIRPVEDAEPAHCCLVLHTAPSYPVWTIETYEQLNEQLIALGAEIG